MNRDYFRKVAFGIGMEESIPSDPLVWAQNQFDTVPNFVWEKKLPTLDEQRDRYGHWVYQDREVLREKHKNDRLAYEKEKDYLRKITGEKFFESLELSVRHTTALASDSPAFERMWHFWGNFFAISEKDYLASFSTGVYHREVIRPNMVNTFEDLVYAVTTSWCMLHHLDNAENIGPNSKEGVWENSNNDKRKVGLNENHARELLELHTLSPEANYTQEDVVEMAKVMTGWRYLWSKKKLEAGPIKFQPEYHEQGPYKILGKVYDIKDFNTVNQGKELKVVIKDLANHPSTRKHIAKKLCQHFICDYPEDEMIANIIKAWEKNDGNLIEIHKATMETVFQYGLNHRKFSMPELWLLQNAKILDLRYLYRYPKGFEFNGSNPNRSQKLVKDILWEIGHPIYRAKQPNGYIDIEDEWLSPELIIRRLAAARRWDDIANPNVDYNQDYFVNVIEKNFDHPENLLKLIKETNFSADRFAVFANSPEVMRA
tara:strand:+ start:233 stop:1690 length:1458 start_codon:yes stop_codon:yes gene_type:complete